MNLEANAPVLLIIRDIDKMNGVLGHDSVLVMLYWAGENLRK